MGTASDDRDRDSVGKATDDASQLGADPPTQPVVKEVGEDESVPTDPDASAYGGALQRRRTEPRVLAAFRVTYKSLDDLVTAYTVDVSRGGLYIKTHQFLPIGAVVRLHLQLPDEGPELRTVARVAYIIDADESERHDRPVGMGMEFLDVGGAPLADEIARFVARTHPDIDLPPSPAGMSSRILVVDDDIWHRERAAQVMRDAGHDVYTAENGVKALGVAMQVQPDLILTDVQMPTMDGWQLVRMLRARPTLMQIPVVFVTALSSDEQRLQGYRLGVDDYISKPFNTDELALRVQRVLTRARAYPRNVTTTKALRGNLAHVALTTLLSFLEVEKRTGMLLLVRTDEIATLFLREGSIVRIDLPPDAPDLEGAEQLHHLLAWDTGRFELADAAVPDEDSFGVATSAVLLEHAQRLVDS